MDTQTDIQRGHLMEKGETNKKEKVCIDLDAKELREFAKYAGLKSVNGGAFILRAFLSTWIMALPKNNRVENKSSHYKLTNNTSYDRD